MSLSTPALGLISRSVLSVAFCGWLAVVANLLPIASSTHSLFPAVENLPGLMTSTLILLAAGLLPWGVRKFFKAPLSHESGYGNDQDRSGKAQRIPTGWKKTLFLNLSSIRLTLYLLSLSLILIFFGTLDQVHYGIYFTQLKYFEHLIAVWQYPQQWLYGGSLTWLNLPLPGGYLLGPLLIVNLTAAHFRYFRPSWKKTGIVLIHAGVVLLLVGQLATQLGQTEYFMWLAEGQKKNYVEAFHEDEFYIIEKAGNTDLIYSWDARVLDNPGTVLRHPDLPFSIQSVWFAKNAAIFPRTTAPNADFSAMPYNRGIGTERELLTYPNKPTYAQGERNITTAIVRITAPEGSIGTWLTANIFRQTMPVREIFPPQTFTHDGRTFEVGIRFKRQYLPADVELLEFRHDRYPGTDIPFNFSSQVSIHDAASSTHRETLIYMNHPLRYAGLTFYQASFAENDTMSMFQVVRNPARWVPYLSCLLTALGLVFQFGLSLFRHTGKNSHA